MEPFTYRLEKVAAESGTYDHGALVGTVRLLDASGQEVASVDLDRRSPSDESLAAGVFTIFPRTTAVWLGLAERAFAEQRISEGLVCVARAVAKGADPALLRSALAAHTLPVTVSEAERRAGGLVDETTPRLLLNALLSGASPTAVFRRLAGLLAGPVALDLIEAAIAIADDPAPLLFTRGLLRVLNGNAAGARADAKTLRHCRAAEHELLMDAIIAIDEDRSSDDAGRVTMPDLRKAHVA